MAAEEFEWENNEKSLSVAALREILFRAQATPTLLYHARVRFTYIFDARIITEYTPRPSPLSCVPVLAGPVADCRGGGEEQGVSTVLCLSELLRARLSPYCAS